MVDDFVLRTHFKVWFEDLYRVEGLVKSKELPTNGLSYNEESQSLAQRYCASVIDSMKQIESKSKEYFHQLEEIRKSKDLECDYRVLIKEWVHSHVYTSLEDYNPKIVPPFLLISFANYIGLFSHCMSITSEEEARSLIDGAVSAINARLGTGR